MSADLVEGHWPAVVPYLVDSTSFLRWTRTQRRKLVLRSKHATQSTMVIRRESVWKRASPDGSSVREVTR